MLRYLYFPVEGNHFSYRLACAEHLNSLIPVSSLSMFCLCSVPKMIKNLVKPLEKKPRHHTHVQFSNTFESLAESWPH